MPDGTTPINLASVEAADYLTVLTKWTWTRAAILRRAA